MLRYSTQAVTVAGESTVIISFPNALRGRARSSSFEMFFLNRTLFYLFVNTSQIQDEGVGKRIVIQLTESAGIALMAGLHVGIQI